MTNDLPSTSLQSSTMPPTEDYDACDRTIAVLRICGDELDPEALTKRLRITPSKSQRREQVFTNSLGRSRTAKVGGWFLSSEDNVHSKDLRRHLDWLIAQLRDVVRELTTLQNEPGIQMWITVIWWAKEGGGWFTLEPQHMRAMSEMNLECQFELAFYGPEDDPLLFKSNKVDNDTGP
jgi:Domain of unknown function (DUF4279)